MLCHIEKEADLTRLPDLTLAQMANLTAKATDIRYASHIYSAHIKLTALDSILCATTGAVSNRRAN